MGRCKKQPKSKYSQQHLIAAMQAVRDGSSQFAAAKKFSIPRSTLFNKIHGKTKMGKKPGPSTVLLPEEEHIIVKWMFELAHRGFPVTKRQLLRSIQLYLNINKRKTIFTKNFPGRKWYSAFCARHPLISEKISQNLTIRRAAVSEDNIRSWHAEILKYCEEHNLLDVLNDPARIFNMDEKGFVLTPSKEVVLVKRGDKAVYNRSKNDEKECVTALLGGSAAGLMTPPMIIHSFKRMPASILLNNPEGWSVGISDSGWQTQQTFHDYMTNIFYKWLLEEKIQLPVIVFIDGHKSHVSLTLSDFCATHQIELIALYPNSTHLTQAMDVGVFRPLNSKWTDAAKDWRLINKYAKIERKDVANILAASIKFVDYAELLKKAFEKCGLFPFNVENVDFTRVLPSIADSAAPQDQLWHQTEASANIVENSTRKDRNAAVDRLQHFECLVGDSVLNLFRSSVDVWTGAKEYSIVFTIWKQMYLEASESMAAQDSDPIIMDSENINGISDDILRDGVAQFITIDGDDGTWLLEEINSSLIVELNTTMCQKDAAMLQAVDVTEQCSILSNCTSESNTSIEDRCKLSNCTSESNTEIECRSDDGIIPILSPMLAESNESGKERGHPEITATFDSDNKSQKTFNPDAFKDAFFWASEDKKKTKKLAEKKIRPKISSVMSSEDWRQHEQTKRDEKLQIQAEKDARKAARESKKLESAKMAAQKLKLKQEKMAAAKIAAENKLLKRLDQNKTKIGKRSHRATNQKFKTK